VYPLAHTGCGVQTPEVLLRKKKSSHAQSSHRLNRLLPPSTKCALATGAQAADSPSEVREQAGVQAGWYAPHMYMPTRTVLGSQQKSLRLWKTARACSAV
jgi:hypothetical protein